MSTVVAKIISEDGTERQFGPVEVTNNVVEELTNLLAASDQERQGLLLAKQMAEAQAEVVSRNEAAQAEQDRREALAANGIDPDAPKEN